MRRSLLLPVLLLPLRSAADTPAPPPESENYCRDPASWERYEELRRQAPGDPLIIRSYALRLGLCRLIDEGKISLEQGAEVFDTEKLRMLLQRAREREGREQPKPAPVEAGDSRG